MVQQNVNHVQKECQPKEVLDKLHVNVLWDVKNVQLSLMEMEKERIIAEKKALKEEEELKKRRKSECEDLIQSAVKLKNEKKFKDGLKQLAKAKEMNIPEKAATIKTIKSEIEELRSKNSLANRLGNWINTILDENN